MYPEYDDENYGKTDIHKYTFPHRKTHDVEEEEYDNGYENMDTDDMQFNSIADYEDFLIWGTDYKDQFF